MIRFGALGSRDRSSVFLVPYAVFVQAWAAQDLRRPLLWHVDHPQDAFRLKDIEQKVQDYLYAPSMGEDAALRRAYGNMEKAARWFGTLTFPLRVYRGLSLAEGKSVRLADPGRHWTPRAQIAETFAFETHEFAPGVEGGTPTILEGWIDRPEFVKWRESFEQYLAYSVFRGVDPTETEEQVSCSLVSKVRVVTPQTIRRTG